MYTGTDGSLPTTEIAKSIFKPEFIFFSFGDADSQVDALKELFRLDSFDTRTRAYVRLLLSSARKLRQASYQKPTTV